jgi:predicted site-specific integrase-resolvase
MKTLSKILLIALMPFIFSACKNTRTVERVDPKETIDLSGRWNDTDARLVAEEMVKDVLQIMNVFVAKINGRRKYKKQKS